MSAGLVTTTINACLIAHEQCQGGYHNEMTGLTIRCNCPCHTKQD